MEAAKPRADTAHMHRAEANPEIEQWCRGCRRTGSRPFSAREIRWIRALRAAHAREVATGFAIVPLGVALLAWFGSWVLSRFGEAGTWALGVAAFFTFFLLLPVAIVRVRDHGRLWWCLGRDLAGGEAWEFEPPRRDEDERDAAPAELLEFALLPVTRRIVDPEVRFPETAVEDVLDLDPPRGIEFYAPLSLQVSSSDPSLEFAQRPLSAGERGELDRVRRSLFMPRPSTAFAVVTLIVVLGVSRLVAEGYADHLPRWSEALSLALCLALCVRTLMRYTRSVLLAGRLGRDLETGLVVRIRGGEPRDAEMLPFSRLFWRIAGAPAEWRDRRRAAETLRASL